METKSEKIYGYIGTTIFIALLLLLLLILNLRAEKPMMTPPEGIDIEVESGMKSSGGGDPSENTTQSASSNSSNTMSSDNNSTDHAPVTNNNTSTSNNNSTSNNWDNAWNNSNNSSTNNSSNGTNSGPLDGPLNNGGNKPCKGCNGSGQTLGNGDATHLVVPRINNQDEGVIVVKVKIDKNGKVIEVKEHGQQGTYGNLSEDSYRKAREAAFKTKFKPEPGINEYRTGYIKYNLRRN